MKNNYKRELNIIFQKAGSGSITSKISLPKDWVNLMGLTPENRQVIVTFDELERKITIKAIK